ncbi:MAG: HlyD family efflux transporter periplasmic adaptor subunit [Acidobacteriota bacterium]
MRRRWSPVVAVVVAVLAAGVWSQRSSRAWVTVQRGDLVLSTEANGTLESTETESLGPPSVPDTWQFKLSFLAPEGKEVKAGEPVMGFDTAELERRLAEQRTKADRATEQLSKTRADRELEAANAKLALAQAESALGKAKLRAEAPAELMAGRELERTKIELAEAGHEADFRRQAVARLAARVQAELSALAGERDAAHAAVAVLEGSIARMRVPAPRDGTVVYSTDWRGEKKKVGDPCWRGQSVLELPRLDRLQGTIEVPEADAGRLAVGQRVHLRLDSRPDREYSAVVDVVKSTVSPVSAQNPRRVVRARIALATVDAEAMRPAMRFQATVELERVGGALLLPRSALQVRNGQTVVVRRRWFGEQAIVPSLGRTDGEHVEVLSGLAPGDQVEIANSGQAHGKSS